MVYELELTSAAVGAIGGLARGVFGLWKAMEDPKFKVNWIYLGTSVVVAGICGAIFAFAVNLPPELVYLAIPIGYVGIDIAETLAKKGPELAEQIIGTILQKLGK